MIEGHEKFKMKGEGNSGVFFMEVNWKGENDEQTNNCKLIKFIFPNGDTSIIKKEHLNAVLFALGTAAEQMKMIPQKMTRVKHYETTLGVKATKDIKKGETIVFPLSITLPSAEQEAIAEIKREKRSESGLIVPNN